jgi:ring-1,2-phenylacetyl-CoA epoxidase subunit PaaD
MPVLTLADLGVVRAVEEDDRGGVRVTITPTYTGCPALATIKADLRLALDRAGFAEVEVRTALLPAWDPSWISERGRTALLEAGIAPPGDGRPACPRCGSGETRETSGFGPTPCTAMHRCTSCLEPFDGVKAR